MKQKIKKILVVDDDEGILEAVKIILENEGYEISTSVGAEYFVDFEKRANKPDLILLDVLLSGADGREICQKLKSNDLTRHIPIIMFSAHPAAEATVKKAGANAFLSKPFNIKELFSMIEGFLKKTK